MAATVLNGTTSGGSVSWTNTTGGNVRLIINYFGLTTPDADSTTYGIRIAIGTVQFNSPLAIALGKTLGFVQAASSSSPGFAYGGFNSLILRNGSGAISTAVPTELFVPPTTTVTMSRISGTGEYSYNLLVLPEDG